MSVHETQRQCKINPFQYELNCKSSTVATIVTAIVTIGFLAGVFAVLTSQGISVGPLNALRKLTTLGGGILAGSSGILLLISLAWWVAKVKQACSQPKKEIEAKPKEKKVKITVPDISTLSKSPLNPYFADAVDLSSKGVKVDNIKVQELIAVVHQIDSKEELESLLGRATPNTFLHNLLTCRLARLALEEKGHHLFDPENTIVIPVCKEGKNRSAAISGVLQLMYPELEVWPVHGAVGGFDPGKRGDWSGLAAYVNVSEEHEKRKYDGFRLAFGVDRPSRFGESKCRELDIPLGTKEWGYYSGVKLAILYSEVPTSSDKRQANLENNDRKVEALKEWHDNNLYRLGNTSSKQVVFIPVVKQARKEVISRLSETGGKATVTEEVDYRDHTNTARTTEEAAEQFTGLLTTFLEDLTSGKIFSFEEI